MFSLMAPRTTNQRDSSSKVSMLKAVVGTGYQVIGSCALHQGTRSFLCWTTEPTEGVYSRRKVGVDVTDYSALSVVRSEL